MYIYLILVILLIILSVMVDIRKNKKIKIAPKRRKDWVRRTSFLLYDLYNKDEVDWGDLDSAIEHLESFALPSLIRILYEFKDKIPLHKYEELKKTILNFRFWLDQPGEDSMCYWSENHQILHSTGEYLLGQFFNDEIFTNDGRLGKEHKELGKDKLNIWFEQRFLYGYVEWYSNVYYEKDIAALSVLIDFAKDDEIVTRAKMALDLLLFDMATQSYYGNFLSTSGRSYERRKMSGIIGNQMRYSIEHVWEFGLSDSLPGPRTDFNFIVLRNYEVPEVIKKIGYDHNQVVIKASNGLNLSELQKEGLNGTKLNQIMMQWAMEAFSNPEVINNSIKYIENNNLFTNDALNSFKMINYTILKVLGLLPLISKVLNPITNGTVIQRANTYTYRTKDYMLATAQNYHPGFFGDQIHIWSLTLDETVSIFTTHPAKAYGEGQLANSPSYWVGNGRNPHSVQDENINMTIYKIGNKKGFMEKELLHYTHAYLPTDKFDEVKIDNNYAFARLRNTFIALIGYNYLKYIHKNVNVDDNRVYDLIQEGETTFWITEVSTEEIDETFDNFINRIKSNEIVFDDKKMNLRYTSNNKVLELKYKGDFIINNEKQNLEYKRFDSKYSEVDRKANDINIKYNGSSLSLNFKSNERIIK